VTGPGGLGEQSVTDYLKYIGGKAGKADQSLRRFSIGWVNQQGGQVEIGKFATNGAELAVKYVNEELGGSADTRSSSRRASSPPPRRRARPVDRSWPPTPVSR
jgi:hypothetical protein